MLGIYLSPDGNNREQVKYMRTKSLTWETSIRSGGIQKDKSRNSLKSNIPQPLKYILTGMTLTHKQFQVITATIVKYGVAQSGLSSTIHMAVRYGPSSLGGIELMDLFLQYGAG